MLGNLVFIARSLCALDLRKRTGEGVFIQSSLLPFQVKKQISDLCKALSVGIGISVVLRIIFKKTKPRKHNVFAQCESWSVQK